MSEMETLWRIFGRGCGAGKVVLTIRAGKRGVEIWMSASRPEIYSLTKLESAPEESRGRGTTLPETSKVMLGCVNWNGWEWTEATVTDEPFGSGAGRAMKKGSWGAWNSTSRGMGLSAVAFAESSMVPCLEAMLKELRWTRSEKLGRSSPLPGRGSPGSEGTSKTCQTHKREKEDSETHS